MGAYGDQRLPVGEGLEPGLAFLLFQTAGQQHHADAQGCQPLGEVQVVLFGEYLGRRHQRGLRAVFGGADGGEGGNHRLAAAHVALQQPQHGRRQRQIVQHFRDYPALRPGQLETQVLQQRSAELLGAGQRHGDLLRAPALPVTHDQVIGGQLVPGDAFLGRLDVFIGRPGRRPVQIKQGPVRGGLVLGPAHVQQLPGKRPQPALV